MRFHPHSIELRYSLGLLAYHLNRAQPASVHLATQSADLAISAVRAFGLAPFTLRVDSTDVQRAAQDTFGLIPVLESDCRSPADFGVYPFPNPAQLKRACERSVAAACENSISYKSIAYPGSVPATVFSCMAALKPNYAYFQVDSLYTPKFITLWCLAKCLEGLDSALYFQMKDYAMRRLIGYGPMWRLSYLVVIVGRKRR